MKNRKAIEKEWHTKGFSCDLWVDPPGQVWEDFKHETNELVYVLEGKIEFEIEGKRRTLSPGDEGFIPKNSLHSARNVGGTTAKWLYGYKN